MEQKITVRPGEGGVTAPNGFQAIGGSVGIKKNHTKDMAIIYSVVPCVAAGTFTTNQVKAAPVKWDKDIISGTQSVQAVVVNSGIANAATGKEGDEACRKTAEAASEALSVPVESVLLGSTGVIGKQMPVDIVCAGVKKLAPLLPEKTVVVTNSSTLLPSMFVKYTGRPDKYLSLHFANSIWKNNTAEVMTQPQTDMKYFDEVMQFANDIRMIGLPVRKEKSGYLLNSMLVPFLLSGLDLYASGISDPESIDIAWTRGTGAPKGPFQIFDTVGLNTAYNIVHQYHSVPGIFSPLLKKMMMPYNFKKMEEILKKYIDEGKLGMSTGEGFYKYK